MWKDEGSQWQSFIVRQMDLCAGTETSAAMHCSSNQSPRGEKIIHFLYDRKVNMKTRMESLVSSYFLFSLLLYCGSAFYLQYFCL
jgi:hypothetical protein